MPSSFEAGEVARHRVALALHLDEGGGGLDRVLVVAERDMATPGHAADLTGLDGLVVIVDDDGVGSPVDVDDAASLLWPVSLARSLPPVKPVSEAPTASVISTSGRSSKSRSLTTGLNTAALDDTMNSDDAS